MARNFHVLVGLMAPLEIAHRTWGVASHRLTPQPSSFHVQPTCPTTSFISRRQRSRCWKSIVGAAWIFRGWIHGQWGGWKAWRYNKQLDHVCVSIYIYYIYIILYIYHILHIYTICLNTFQRFSKVLLKMFQECFIQYFLRMLFARSKKKREGGFSYSSWNVFFDKVRSRVSPLFSPINSDKSKQLNPQKFK